MGVPGLFAIYAKTYPNILRKQRGASGPTTPSAPSGSTGAVAPAAGATTDLLIDYNGTIHQAARRVMDRLAGAPDLERTLEDPQEIEGLIFRETWEYTKRCIVMVGPTAATHIYIDGVAPVAKLIQQRKRRYMAQFRNRLTGKSPLWDTNAISPGTPFMIRLQAFLRERIRNDPVPGCPRIYLSGADEAGEGEHKLFAKIPGLVGANITIYGLDADLIILSLLANRPGLVLMREENPSGPVKHSDEMPPFVYLDVDELRRGILDHLRGRYQWPVFDDRQTIINYVAITFLLGNDFLPHPITVSLKNGGHDKLLVSAKGAFINQPIPGRPLISEKNEWNLAFLVLLLQSLAANEDRELVQLNDTYIRKKPYENPDDPYDSYPLVNKDPLAVAICNSPAPLSKWRLLYYKHLFHARMYDTSIIMRATHQYFLGLDWTLRYYLRQSKDPYWYYPYTYAPTMRDLSNYVSTLGETDLQEHARAHTVPASSKDSFVHPHVQLLAIMPPGSRAILPRPVQTAMTGPLDYMFPDEFQVQTFLKSHLWECAPILPPLDLVAMQQNIQQH